MLLRWLDEFRDDVRFGARQLKGAPGFTFVAAVTLALGIGANAAVFGVVKSVLLDALPYTDAHRLVRVYGGLRNNAIQRGPLSAGTVSEISSRQHSFESLASFGGLVGEVVFGSDDGPRVAKSAWVEPKLFETLGVSAALGRTFQRDETTSGFVPLSGGQASPDTARVVVLTHNAWQRLFSGEARVVGKEVRVNGLARTVIGVLPRGFVGPMGEADFYFAFDSAPVIADPVTVRRSQWLGLVARLKPGITPETGIKEVHAIWANLEREYPEDNGSLGIAAMPLRDAMVGDTRTPLLVLMASAALVLLIACANLAATLLSRAIARRKEFAVRVALGAGRRRIVRQLLTESTLLAFGGGAAGLMLAAAALNFLDELALPVLPAYVDLALDRGAVLITAALALFTGLAFGMAPAFSAGRPDPQSTLRDESRGASEGLRSTRLRGALMAGQLALCISLLVGAGLLARSLWAMTVAPLGFQPDGVLSAAIQLPSRDYPTPAERLRFHERFMDRVRALPGVEAVANTTALPTAVFSRASFTIAGTIQSGAPPFVLTALVSEEYFPTLQIPLRAGRMFNVDDRIDRPRAVVVSESMARRFWPRGDVLGSRIRLGPNPKAPLAEVVGIVGDVRNNLAQRDAEPMVYGSTRQFPPPMIRVLMRTTGDPLALVRPLERVLSEIDPSLALQNPMTLPALLGEGLASRRLPVFLMTAFGALALILASVGVYAMFASMAAAREREFGVRMALGSRPRSIAMLVLKQGAGWMAAGLAAGVVGILLVVRFVSDLLYDVAPFDPVTLGSSVAILIGCATLALLVPLRRATRVDPAVALRAQ